MLSNTPKVDASSIAKLQNSVTVNAEKTPKNLCQKSACEDASNRAGSIVIDLDRISNLCDKACDKMGINSRCPEH